MNNFKSPHNFHIPVLGLGFTIDTPIKVGRFGISSVLSIVEDFLIESMREVHCKNNGLTYIPITNKENDYRAKRITAYLDLLNLILENQMKIMKSEPFEKGYDIVTYFDLLPDTSPLHQLYLEMLHTDEADEKSRIQEKLRTKLVPGAIDVNIMTKLDKINYSSTGEKLDVEYSDALSALRGYANSSVISSIVFSAGMNPRLFSYCELFPDFFPDGNGYIKKKIILKVSDYRSALIQGKFFAKKGLWISEFRIESGLNCGGHAFATDGLLMGPILEEFKIKRNELYDELYLTANNVLRNLGKPTFLDDPELKITAQGGVGTAEENDFLLKYFNLSSIGWGSPFLMVPEATNVEPETLNKLAVGKKEDYYLSNSSPLGVPFNNFRLSSSEKQRKERIAKNRPGSPCYKKFLSFDTEFTEKPICTASREYQNFKIKQAAELYPEPKVYDNVVAKIIEKDCLCEGLGASALIVSGANLSHNLSAVSICPGPNLAFFSGIFSLKQMVDHIYGRINLLNTDSRPHVFINELRIYIDYLKKELDDNNEMLTSKKRAYFDLFRLNLTKGIEYYKSIATKLFDKTDIAYDSFLSHLLEAEFELHGFAKPTIL